MQSSLLLATPDYLLSTLIGSVRSVTTRQLGWVQTADFVAERLTQHLPSPDVLTAEQRAGDPLGYASHVLHCEADGSFSVVALVWLPGQATPIHDHVTWCVTGVIQGTECEERYVLRDGVLGDGVLDDGVLCDGVRLEQLATRTNSVGDVFGLAPPGDIHRVRNAGAGTAISLHIYGTDVSRLGSSIRRVYEMPVAADARRRQP